MATETAALICVTKKLRVLLPLTSARSALSGICPPRARAGWLKPSAGTGHSGTSAGGSDAGALPHQDARPSGQRLGTIVETSADGERLRA